MASQIFRTAEAKQSDSPARAATAPYKVVGKKRRGQALVVAVLLMVFAALLGSTFLTVIALNLNQTAREEDRSLARAATQAGFLFINEQLTQSPQGEQWRPEILAPPPAPMLPGDTQPDPEYDVYYTKLEQAQGWARTSPRACGEAYANQMTPFIKTGVYGDWDNDGVFDPIKDDWAKLEHEKLTNPTTHVYVKIPDPRQPANKGAASYLTEVKYLPRQNDVGLTPDTSETPDKQGLLRITVIGLAQNNPNVFEKRVRYKGSSLKQGPLSFARFDANTAPGGKRLLETSIKPGATDVDLSGPAITVENANGLQPGTMLVAAFDTRAGKPLSSSVGAARAATSAIVRSVNAATGRVVLSALPDGFTPGAKIQAASTLMGGLNASDMDADGDPTTVQTADDSTDVPTLHADRGVFFNGGMVLQGKTVLGLNPNSANGSPDTVSASGRIVKDAGAQAMLAQTDGDTTRPSSTEEMPDSTTTGRGSALQNLVRDASGNATNDPTKISGGVQSLSAPRIDGPYSRYLEMTRLADVSSGSAFGYGPGVFLDNADDVEKVTTQTATGASLRPLQVFEMHRLWQRKSFETSDGMGNIQYSGANAPIAGTSATNGRGGNAYRLAFPRSGAASDSYTFPLPSGSLEERGVRGWVSPSEFLARGAQIELQGDKNRIIITREDRSDALNAPDAAKAWKTIDGAPLPHVYRMVLEFNKRDGEKGPLYSQRWFGAPGHETLSTRGPNFNGVLYAQGNVRVRGQAGVGVMGETGNVGTRDLTIVSMGNIYVEGSLKRGGDSDNGPGGRIALLAKKNVVLNPTEFAARVEGSQDRDIAQIPVQTVVETPGTTDEARVEVSDVSPFRVGDRVRLEGDSGWHTLSGVESASAQTASGAGTASVGGTLILQEGPSNIIPAKRRVVLLSDPALVGGTSANPERFYNLANNSDVFARVLHLDASGPYTLNLLHASERKKAFDLALVAEDVHGQVQGSLKDDASQDGLINANEKVLRTTNLGVVGCDHAFAISLTDPRYATLKAMQDEAVRITMRGRFPRWKFSNTFADGTSVDPALVPSWALSQSNGIAGKLGSLVAGGGGVEHEWPMMSAFLTSSSTLSLGAGNGFNPANALQSLIIGGASNDVEAADIVSQGFSRRSYGPDDDHQAALQWTSLPLDTSAAPSGDFTVALQPNQDPNGVLPAYRVGALRVERGLDSNSTPQSGLDVSIEATIFAQDGSWFVVPVPALSQFHKDASGTIPTAQYEDILSGPEDAAVLNLGDTNHDNVLDTTERAALKPQIMAAARAKSTRFRRLNYAVTVRGSILENRTPTALADYDLEPDPDGNTSGAMKTWIDSMSHPTQVASVGGQTYGRAWRSITYEPLPARPDSQLALPVSPSTVFTG